MTWKNALQLDIEHSDADFRDRFTELYAVSRFLADCVVQPGYNPPDALGQAVCLSPFGLEMASTVQTSSPDYRPSEIKLALMVQFFHHDLYVDLHNTDVATILNHLHNEVISGSIRYPWVYDRCLYDRFFEMFPDRTKFLSPEETMKLLEGTPPGVFQLRDIIVGPFGVLRSDCHRDLSPTRTAPLWHCSDPACSVLHPVTMRPGSTRISTIVEQIVELGLDQYGPQSEWDSFFRNCLSVAKWYDDYHPGAFPWLLANAFGEEEIRSILEGLLRTYPDMIRQRIPKVRKVQNLFQDSPEKIAAKLSKAQCFQLALIAPDDTLIEMIEALIEDGTICIPSTEVRRPMFWRSGGNWFNVEWECSQFGVRAVPRRSQIALLRLKRLIRELYRQQDNLEGLQWALRHSEGESIHEKLDRYVHSHDPRQIINELVLSGQGRIQSAFLQLRYGRFKLPSSLRDEERLVNKILWKLGFNVGLYPPHQETFWRRHARLLDAARTYTDYNENDKEQIRSAGANFFVSLEEVLDYSLSFITWAVLSDHYGGTGFNCDLDEARCFMADKLNKALVTTQTTSDEPLEYNPEGVNTLYPLIEGFRVLACICGDTLNDPSSDLRRPKHLCPGYHSQTEIQIFPFLHRVLLLDLNETDRKRLIQTLEEITATLVQAKISSIRNRMQHKRKEHEFPSQQEIVTACDTIARTVDKMEKSGISPLIYLYAGSTTDQFERNIVRLKDYKGREVLLYYPSQFAAANLPSPHQAVIVVPSLRIGSSFEPIRFAFKEKSEFAQNWRDYPKRRARTPDEEFPENVII